MAEYWSSSRLADRKASKSSPQRRRRAKLGRGLAGRADERAWRISVSRSPEPRLNGSNCVDRRHQMPPRLHETAWDWSANYMTYSHTHAATHRYARSRSFHPPTWRHSRPVADIPIDTAAVSQLLSVAQRHHSTSSQWSQEYRSHRWARW